MVREKQKRSEAHMKMDRSLPPKTWRLALKGMVSSHLAGTSISRSSKNFKGSMTKAFCGSQKITYLALKQPSVFWWHTSFQRKAIDGLWEETGWEVRETIRWQPDIHSVCPWQSHFVSLTPEVPQLEKRVEK